MATLQITPKAKQVMSDHLKGLIITTLGVLFVVPDSLFVRLINSDPITIAFWRGISSGGLILIGLFLFKGARSFATVREAGLAGITYIFLIGSTTLGFVLAISWTSVANVVFIFASMPIFSAIFSRVFLGEKLKVRMLITMVFVIIGLGIITYGSLDNDISSWQGDLAALYVTIAYAGALTTIRKIKHLSMIPAIPIAYIGAGLLLLPFSDPINTLQLQWPLILGHGIFIALATCLLALGPRFISSTEVSLLILLESVLAPLLVWMVIGEDPGGYALIGGTIVIAALLISNLVLLVKSSRLEANASN